MSPDNSHRHSNGVIEHADVFRRQREARRGDVFLEMGNPERSRDRQDDRAVLQQPREGDLSCRGPMRLRDASDGAARFRQFAGCEREPRNEADVVLVAIREHRFAAAVDEVVAVLHRRDWKYATGRIDVLDGDLTQSRIADETVVQQLPNSAELLVGRYSRIDSMQLPEIDPFDAELLETPFGLCDQMSRTSIHGPLIRPWTGVAGLGRDQKSFVRMKRLANQHL